MTTPPADWYDDPENPAIYRYWDGSQWTEHRSPKRTPGSGNTANAESAWSVFGRTFRLFGSRWREAAIVSIPAFLGQMISFYLAFDAIDELLGGRAQEVFDKFTSPGFEPLGADRVWLESFDAQYSSTIGLKVFTAVIVFAIPLWITILALIRLFVAAANGVRQTASESFRGALSRLGRSCVNYVMLLVGLMAVVIIPLVIGAIVPLLLIVIIPALLLLGIYVLPHSIIFSVSVAAGLRDRSPFGDAIATPKGRWGYLFRRVLVLILATVAAGFAIGVFSQAALYLSLGAYLLFNALSQVIQNAVASAGYAVIWKDAGTPTDPALLPAALPDTVIESPVV